MGEVGRWVLLAAVGVVMVLQLVQGGHLVLLAPLQFQQLVVVPALTIHLQHQSHQRQGGAGLVEQ
jgi:hypothetical protein